MLGWAMNLAGVALIIGMFHALAKEPAQDWPIDSKLDGPVSIYTELLVRKIRAWPLNAPSYKHADANPVQMRCIETPGNRRFIGVEQSMLIQAPLAKMTAVLDDFEHYKDLSPGFEDIRVTQRDKNRVVTFWEKHIPFFFLPNMKYEMTYLIERRASGRVVYRYQLKNSTQLRTADGLIVIEMGKGPAAETVTHFTRYDFIDPTLAVFASAPVGLVWENSLEDIYLSDAGMKLKAEHPDWSYEKIVSQARQFLERFPVTSLRKHCHKIDDDR